MTHITHLTLNTGHASRALREDVSDDALLLVRQWLAHSLASGQPESIPGASPYTGLALQADGALIVTVYAPTPEAGRPHPLVTFGVAPRSRHAPRLWEMLTAQPGVKAALRQPGPPWCAVIVQPALVMHTSAADWLGDFERDVAWAWATQHPDIKSAQEQ